MKQLWCVALLSIGVSIPIQLYGMGLVPKINVTDSLLFDGADTSLPPSPMSSSACSSTDSSPVVLRSPRKIGVMSPSEFSIDGPPVQPLECDEDIQKSSQESATDIDKESVQIPDFQAWARASNFSSVLEKNGGTLAGMAAPKQHDYAIISVLASGRSILIVNLLAMDEQKALFAKHEYVPVPAGMEKITTLFVPLQENKHIPQQPLSESDIEMVEKHIACGGLVVVHCRQGIMRTGVILAYIMTYIMLDEGKALSVIQQSVDFLLKDRGTSPFISMMATVVAERNWKVRHAQKT